MTMMKAVIGPCVVAARKPTMPSAMSGIAASGPTWVSSATSLPMPAPMASDGAKTPAGTPVQADSQVAQNFEQRVDAGQFGLAGEQRRRRCIAGAGRGAAGDESDHRHAEGAAGGKRSGWVARQRLKRVG